MTFSVMLMKQALKKKKRKKTFCLSKARYESSSSKVIIYMQAEALHDNQQHGLTGRGAKEVLKKQGGMK